MAIQYMHFTALPLVAKGGGRHSIERRYNPIVASRLAAKRVTELRHLEFTPICKAKTSIIKEDK
jgi:hypothetical protein